MKTSIFEENLSIERGMKMRKVIALFLGVVLLFGIIFTACTTEDKQDTNATQSNSQETQPEETESTEPKEKVEISVTVYDRGRCPASEGTMEENRWTEWINENAPVNVKLVVIPRWESADKLNIFFAAGTAPDLIFEYNPRIKNPLYYQGQLFALDDLIENHSKEYKEITEEYPAILKAGMKDDGKVYEFGIVNELRPLKSLFIRQDWLDNLGLDIPETVEEYYSVVEAFTKQDPDGNNQDDTYGVALSSDSGFLNLMFGVSEYYPLIQKDNTMMFDWESARESVAMQKRMYEEGIVDKDYLNDEKGAKAKQDFITGKLGTYASSASYNSLEANEWGSLKKNVPEAEITWMPIPEGPNGKFTVSFLNPVQATAVVNKNAKDPVAVMQYVDWLCKPEVNTTLSFGFEGVHYNLINGLPKVIDVDKYNTEVRYMSDLAGMMHGPFDGLQPLEDNINTDSDLGKEIKEKYIGLKEWAMDPALQYFGLTLNEHQPEGKLPNDLLVFSNSIKPVLQDIFAKCIVSGDDYTVDQAITDAKKAFEEGKGNELEAWYQDWYTNHRNETVLMEDVWKLYEKQKKLIESNR